MDNSLFATKVIDSLSGSSGTVFDFFGGTVAATYPAINPGALWGQGVIIDFTMPLPSTDASGPDQIIVGDPRSADDLETIQLMEDFLALSLQSFTFWDSDSDDVYDTL